MYVAMNIHKDVYACSYVHYVYGYVINIWLTICVHILGIYFATTGLAFH